MLNHNQVLKLENVYKSVHNVTLLHNINLTVGKGEVIGIVGSQGTGKTTLLQIMMGHLFSDEGNIRMGGVCIMPSIHKDRHLLGIGISTFQNSDLILLDEPLKGLDEEEQTRFVEIMDTMTANQASIIVTTENVEEISHVCTRIYQIEEGSLSLIVAPKDIPAYVDAWYLEYLNDNEYMN